MKLHLLLFTSGFAAVSIRWLVVSVLAIAASYVQAESIVEGRVRLPPARHAPVITKRYDVVSKGGVVAMDPPLAVVYLEGPFPSVTPPPTVQLPQKGLAFIPTLLPVQVGTRVEFPNYDDTYHNIFSYSPPKRFDLGRYRADERPVPSQVFDVPGLVTLRCEIHEHMRGIVLVLETPHFVVTDGAGRFRLAGLPAGRYQLKAWLSSKTTMEKSLELKDGATLQVEFP